MQIEERAVGDVIVLDLKGKITLGEGDELLKDKVNSLVNQGHKKIVLNLAEVPYIDSAGLGEIVRTYTTVSRQGGKWVANVPIPARCVEKDGTLRIAIERTDSRGRRTSWPRPMLPWDSEPGRVALDTKAWGGASAAK